MLGDYDSFEMMIAMLISMGDPSETQEREFKCG